MSDLTKDRLLVGVGSHHGDDRVGWEIVDRIAARSPDTLNVKTATIPLQLIDWLTGVKELHIVDGCAADENTGTIIRCEYSSGKVASTRSSQNATHGFDLLFVLELAQTLKQLPAQVTIWGVVGTSFDASQQTLSVELQSHLDTIAESIEQEICNARKISGAVPAETGGTDSY